ncbi:MAG: PD-(D/E)XK nuclease family protein [Spirulinaceae cyanobacterium]
MPFSLPAPEATRPSPLTLTQGQLNSFEQCPRRYQYQYLEQLGAPLDPERQARTNWGSQFHRLMQQYILGLAGVSNSPGCDPAMAQALQALTATVPALQDPAARYEAEHRRLWACSAMIAFVVVYDLLVLEPDRAEILDWKTYPQPPNTKQLAENWQTLLYPFVLVETSDYLPEQVAMTYWFVQADQTPTAWRLDYTTPLHQEVRTRLDQHLNHLPALALAFAQTGQDLPPVDAEQQHPHCRYCPFQSRCQQTEQQHPSGGRAMIPQQVADLPEIALGV